MKRKIEGLLNVSIRLYSILIGIIMASCDNGFQPVAASKALNKHVRNIKEQVLEIKDDSMLIRSVPKSACDYVEDYKPISKWVKWRMDHCKLIEFNFCY